MNKRCLYCYKDLKDAQADYHEACSLKFFNAKTPPSMPYSYQEMQILGKELVVKSMTVPGVQAKISLRLEKEKEQKQRLTVVGWWGNFILKPPVEQYTQMPENESFTMKLAELYKIKVVPNALIRLQSGELAYITKRVDRDWKGNKIHMEDLCQLSEKLTEMKYRGSLEQVGKNILKYSSSPLLDITFFLELSVFCFLTGNADMHLKNFSLIDVGDRQMAFSPAYDLLNTRIFIPESQDNEELALTVNGRKGKLHRGDFEVLGRNLGLNQKQIQNSLNRFKNKQNIFEGLLEKCFLSDENKEAYENVFTERLERLDL